MRWPFAFGAFAVAAAVVAFVLAVRSTQDHVPGDLKDCVRDGGGRIARGTEALSALRADAEAGRAADGRRFRMGDDEAVLLRGDDYAVLVLRTPENRSFEADVGRRVYLEPTAFAVVAVGRGDALPVLEACAERLAGDG